ncbi:MAG: cell wall-active antibiotics response protein [Bacillaceae bacterium]|nr:cell wall-active antibiotics response protein [Bacillaceae bacterium]
MFLNDLQIKTGVGETKIDLSNIQKNSFHVDIKSGVGSTTIIVPKDMSVIIDAKKGIGSIKYEGLEKDGNRYKSNVVSEEELTISINQGIGEVVLKAK